MACHYILCARETKKKEQANYDDRKVTESQVKEMRERKRERISDRRSRISKTF